MIFVRLYGGLGNQMFQFAAGASLAKRLNARCYTETSWFDEIKENDNVIQRKYELDFFGIEDKGISKVTSLLLKANPPVVFAEKKFNYNEQINLLSGNVIIDGYWQSERYFSDQESVIRKLFVFKDNFSSKKKKEADLVLNTPNSVALHVRRGDYVSHKAAKGVYWMATLNYYRKATDIIRKKITNPTFFVISDDIDWCRQNIKFGKDIVFLEHIPNHGHEDMRIMSLCEHNIIANSTFSWWAAWLNKNPEKITIAPSHWFNDKTVDTRDLIPKSWLKI